MELQTNSRKRKKAPTKREIADQFVGAITKATKSEMAARYQVSVRTIDNWRKMGLLPSIPIGRKCVRFDVADCDQALAKLKVEANA